MAFRCGVLAVLLALHFAIRRIHAAPAVQANASFVSGETIGEEVDGILRQLDRQSSEESAKSILIQQSKGRPSISQCAQSGAKAKVLGGVAAPSAWRNWFVEIHGQHETCSGARISPRLILTSAHCFFDVTPCGYSYREDCKNYSSDRKRNPIVTLKPPHGNEQSVRIILVYKHFGFCEMSNLGLFLNDVAVAVLEREFTSSFEPGFCLMTHSHPLKSDVCHAVGIGYTVKVGQARNRNRIGTEYAHSAKVRVLDCKRDVDNSIQSFMTEIACTTSAGAKGDSGGPVICEREGFELPYLMGVLSQTTYDEEATILHNATRRVRNWIQNFLQLKKATEYDRCYRDDE